MQGHGVCLQPLNPQCFCNSEYAGDRCERCAAGHMDYPACTEVPWREHFLFEYYPIQNFETPAQIAAGKRVNDSPDYSLELICPALGVADSYRLMSQGTVLTQIDCLARAITTLNSKYP